MTIRLSCLAGAAFAACLGVAPLFAQTTEPAPTEPTADPAAEATQPPGPYAAATFGNWEIICTPMGEGVPESCEMYQLLLDEQASPLAEISIAALPLGAEFAAGATVTTPLETFLPTGLGFRIGEAETMRIEPFRVCTVVGCIVRMGLSVEEIDAMKAGADATLTIAPFVAVDQPVNITISLEGFTAAYEDVQTRLSLAAAATRAGQ